MSRTVLVTGAAAGIGLATARRFAAAGDRVGAFDVDDAGLARLSDELGHLPGEHVVERLDVRDAEAWTATLDRLTASSGGALDVLVNNAGVLASGRFAEIDLAAQRRMVEVNVTGTLTGCHTAHPYLRRATDPHVVNLASASAVYGQPELATYSATKFAVRGLTEALDLEWADDGIVVTALWPLFVSTGMVEGMDIGSTRALGVRLTADDVAAQVLAAAERRPGWRGAHRAVGRQAQLLLGSAAVTPSWLLRQVNRRITGV